MEDSDFLGQMMQTDEAASVRFVRECFLLLDPEDLKACRLVSKQWDEFIKREVWCGATSMARRDLLRSWWRGG